MATITIRDVPDALYEHLKKVAKSERRSINAEVIELIDKGVRQYDEREQRLAALERIGERRRHYGPLPEGSPDSVTLLREDRDR